MSFSERLENLLKENKITQTKLAEDLHIRRTTISEWKKNGAIPDGDICLKIANYLNVSVEWLITGEDNTLSNELRDILNMYTLLDTSQKETVYTLIETLLNKKG